MENLILSQKELMKLYKGVYNLPDWPLDLDSREDQDIIRHLISSLSEELVESWDSYCMLFRSVETNFTRKLNEQLRDLSLELADCLHFFLELLIFSNLTIEDFEIFIDNLATTSNYTWEGELSILEKVQKLSKFHTTSEGLIQTPQLCYPMNLIGPYKAGNKLTRENQQILPILLWDTVSCLFTVQNTLKNKPWKIQETPTDLVRYNAMLMQGLYTYLAYNYMLGSTPESIIENYLEKNQENKNRIKNKY